MTKRDALSISLKVLGVISLAYAILIIPNLFLSTAMPISSITQGISRSTFIWIDAIAIVLYATLSCWLIASSDSLSRMMVKDDSPVSLPESLREKKAVFILAVRVLGVVFSVQGIGFLAGIIGDMSFKYLSRALAIIQWSRILDFVLYLGVGAYLLLCSRQFAAFIYRHEPDNGGCADD
ncbi:hypothetical protein LLG46_02640 [bacterium]|nr:hypothetical protein [bacterium]